MRADVWKETHPDAVRAYRTDERRDTAGCYRRSGRRRLKSAGSYER
jgi:hypothetical protein